MVTNGFLILHSECNLPLQMASTEKLETRAVIKLAQQQGDTPPKTLKKCNYPQEACSEPHIL